MVMRKGLGKGRGKGYKNIIMGHDRRVHRESKYGIKQPQKMTNLKYYHGMLGYEAYYDPKTGYYEDSSGNKGYDPSFKDSDGDGVPDIDDCQPHNPRKQDILIKDDEVDYDVPFDWIKMTYTDKLKLVQQAGLSDNIASKRLNELSVMEVKELTSALMESKYLTKKQVEKIRKRNVEKKQEMGSGYYKTPLDKAKGIKTYNVVPPKEEVKKLVLNLIDIEDGKKVLKLPGTYGDYKVTYEFKGFTKSGNVKLKEAVHEGGRNRILKPYVYNGGLYIAVRDGTGTQILDLQKG